MLRATTTEPESTILFGSSSIRLQLESIGTWEDPSLIFRTHIRLSDQKSTVCLHGQAAKAVMTETTMQVRGADKAPLYKFLFNLCGRLHSMAVAVPKGLSVPSVRNKALSTSLQSGSMLWMTWYMSPTRQ